MVTSPLIIDSASDETVEDIASPEFPITELSVEELTRLVAPFIIESTPAGQPDQRRRQRACIHARATIIPLRESCHPGSLAILVRDVSQAGIGFLYERPMNLDEQFALVLPRLNDTPAVVLCAVACWQPLARNLYGIGARFIRILRDGGLTPLPIEVDSTEQYRMSPMRSKAS